MNTPQMLEDLKSEYPGKAIILNPPVNPTEILCEVEPTQEHPDYSVAIAIIDSSKPHYHQVTTETYELIKGNLTLNVDGISHVLKSGDTFTIKPGMKHYATGNQTWVKVTSNPGWTIFDHILIE